MDEFVLKGIGVSEGIAFGRAQLSQVREQQFDGGAALPPEEQRTRLVQAKERSVAELQTLVKKTVQMTGEKDADILNGQISFLQDPMFFGEISAMVERGVPAVQAVQTVTEKVAELFANLPSDYMRERARDVRDVSRRLSGHLIGKKHNVEEPFHEAVIWVAEELAPSEVPAFDPAVVKGIVTKTGGSTSHTAILARSLGIPTILGIRDLDGIRQGDELIVDGTTGELFINPTSQTRTTMLAKQNKENMEKERIASFEGGQARTIDGFVVQLGLNIGSPQEAEAVIRIEADGVGLFRTEFLFMQGDELPTEEEQFRAYKQALLQLEGKPLIIRTMDIGGDKEIPYLQLPPEQNPFLGYRAIRICLDQEEMFRTQLRAIIRASEFGNVKIMFPMIATLKEWRRAKAIYNEVYAELRYPKETASAIEVGMMMEVPSAAILADQFAKEADFFSIGTNDLIQFTLAVDRMNAHVAPLYEPFDLAVIRLIECITKAAHAHGKWVGMCGGMAGDPLAVPLLIAIGIDELSMDAASINIVRYTIQQVTVEECRVLYGMLAAMDNAGEIRGALKEFSDKKRLGL